MNRSARLDEKDIKLIGILKNNSRTPFRVIARELGLTEGAVRKRVKRLVDKGVIKRFTLDYVLPGEMRAIILVKTKSPIPVPEVSRGISRHPFVEKVVEVTGEYDIVAIARARGVDDINTLIDFIRGINGVASTYTMIVLREY
ncbi:MAG: Lrp/AsnC family transcriptional regulator [Aeropyrum sp.]|nr:Lrp/AsnC family transcriptional regulator [Aeropyrum sp.]MCE4615852.1 Lrp/AsnC family transcriptional regulator [Aeropyrum sp.]